MSGRGRGRGNPTRGGGGDGNLAPRGRGRGGNTPSQQRGRGGRGGRGDGRVPRLGDDEYTVTVNSTKIFRLVLHSCWIVPLLIPHSLVPMEKTPYLTPWLRSRKINL